MADLHLEPALQIRVLQRGLTEGLWTSMDLGLGAESDLFSVKEGIWLSGFERLDLAGRIPLALKQEVFDAAQDATRFLDTGPQSRSFPLGAKSRFEPLGFLGDGGMGSVFKAFDRQLGRIVALKFLKHLDDEARSRFLQEIRAQAQIEHPHIVRIFEAGEFDGTPYLAMQFVDGPTLRQAIPLLNLEQEVRIVRDAAEALHACHRQGILHRDIKPSNIMLDATEDGQWHAFIMDFGLARVTAEESRTQVGFLMGTPAYLSPEQAAGQPFDRRSDIYALGTTLYECIAGEPPFSAPDTWELLRKIATEEPPSLRQHLPTLPRDLELIIAKAMDKDPLRRYANARALGEDLTRFLEGDPVLAQPPTLRYKARKILNKHRSLAWVSGISLLSVIGTGVWGLQANWKARRISEAAQRFGAEAEGMEGLLFKAYSLPLHDTRLERGLVLARMEALGKEMGKQGKWSQGAGHFALGRGYMGLGALEQAKSELDLARAWLPSDPAVAQALGLVLAQLYAQELEGLRGRQREDRKALLAETLKVPALRLLQQSGGRGLETPAYAEGMVALVEERYESALAKAREAQTQAPWFYQAWVLEGRVNEGKASQMESKGQFDAALLYLVEAARAFQAASDKARSAPEPFLAEAQRRLTLLRIRFDRAQAREEDKTWALEAVRNARVVDPDNWKACEFASAIHRQWALHLQGQGKSPLPDLEAAAAEARKGLRSNPGQVRLLINLSSALRSKADEEFNLGMDPGPSLLDARGALEQALAQPRFREYLLDGLGNCHLLEGLYALRHGLDPLPILDKAAKSLEESNAIHPWVGHLSSLGDSLTYRAQAERWRGADPSATLRRTYAVFEQALGLNAHSFQIRLGAAQARIEEVLWLEERGTDPTSAIEKLRFEAHEALRLNPSLPEAWTLLALGSMAEAEGLKQKGERFLPSLQKAESELAMASSLPRKPLEVVLATAKLAILRQRLQHESGPSARALRVLESSLKTHPSEARLWFLQGQVLRLSGNGTAADQALSQALILNQNLKPILGRPGCFP